MLALVCILPLLLAPIQATAAAAAPVGGVTRGLPQPVVPFGMGVNIHFTRASAATWRLLAQSGFRFVRTDLTWQSVETAPGVFNFRTPGYDSLMRHLRAIGIRPLLILDYCNSLYPSPATAAGRAAFARFAATAVRHFRGDGVIWEVWNEPGNFWSCTGQPYRSSAYVQLAEAAAAAMRAADPRAFIIGPASGQGDGAGIRAFTLAGLLNVLNAYSVHPYRNGPPDHAVPEFVAMHQWLTAHPVHGRPLPVVSSEWGYDTATFFGAYAASLAGAVRGQQADYLVRMMLGNLQSGVALSIWYDWRDDCGDALNPQCRYGVLAPGPAGGWRPKPAYRAMQTLAHVLAGYRYSPAADVAACGPGMRAMRLLAASGGGSALVFWATGARTTGSFYAGSASARLVNQYGATQRVALAGGVLPNVTFHQAVTYAFPVGATAVPPPAPSAVRWSTVQRLLGAYGYLPQSPVGAPWAPASGTPSGTPVLRWHAACGVGGFEVLFRGSGGGWSVVAHTKVPYWLPPAAALRSGVYVVRALAVTGQAGQPSQPVRRPAQG